MNKHVSRLINVIWSIGFICVMAACSNQTRTQEHSAFREGRHYQTLNPLQPVAVNDGRIEVVEVFLYACPHCNALESKINKWLEDKQDIVNFRRMPAILGPDWIIQAKAYYVAEKLGILDTIQPALLKAIHQDGKQYHNEYSLMEFFIKQGVSQHAFVEAIHSPEVAENLSRARVMTVQYGLRGVPAMIVNGRYKTAQYFTGSQEKMLEVVDSLIEREITRTSDD